MSKRLFSNLFARNFSTRTYDGWGRVLKEDGKSTENRYFLQRDRVALRKYLKNVGVHDSTIKSVVDAVECDLERQSTLYPLKPNKPNTRK